MAPCALGRCPAEVMGEVWPRGAGSPPAAPSPALLGARGVSPALGAVWHEPGSEEHLIGVGDARYL